MSTKEVLKALEDRASEAVKIATRLGEVVGYVSRVSPSQVDEEGGYVVFDVDPVVYFQNFNAIAQLGSFLGVVDIKTLNVVSLKVVSVERRDILAELDLPDMYTPMPGNEVSGLLTKTRIKAKPLLVYDLGSQRVIVANYVIEPQSPVILLKDPAIVQKVMGLPTNGVFLGYATTGDSPLFQGNALLFLPTRAFYQHVLVLGTTGSGKTTLLKNMIASISCRYKLSEDKVSTIIFDPNKDYVTIPLRPLWSVLKAEQSEEVGLTEKVFENIRGVKGLIILLPITKSVVERYIERAETWAKVLREISEEYLKSILKPITSKFGWNYEIRELDVVEEPTKYGVLRYVKTAVSIKYGEEVDDISYCIIPYALRLADLPFRELINLNPYFTRQAKDTLQRLLQAMTAKNAQV
ncbi:MAG: DUF87 domain-containing protein, partial [Desulfurococcaceae archaeon]